MEFVETEDVKQTNHLAIALVIVAFVVRTASVDTTKGKLSRIAHLIALLL